VPEIQPVADVSEWPVDDTETGGLGPNIWLTDPGGSGTWLFKPARQTEDRREGQDWAEFVVARLAMLVSVPTAEIKMVVRDGQPGCLSRNLKPYEWYLYPGAVALEEVDPRVDPQSKEHLGHNQVNIRTVLADCGTPPEFAGPPWFGAYDVFVGYLLLDAWVANQDRHEANWSILVSPQGEKRLAASYDHASSLGFQLLDSDRQRILSGQPGVDQWARRGFAHRFEGGRRVTLVDYAAAALTSAGPAVRDVWLGWLDDVADQSIESVIATTPEMSEPTRTFCLTLLGVNRRRLLDAC
jgi:hypothetical protein